MPSFTSSFLISLLLISSRTFRSCSAHKSDYPDTNKSSLIREFSAPVYDIINNNNTFFTVKENKTLTTHAEDFLNGKDFNPKKYHQDKIEDDGSEKNTADKLDRDLELASEYFSEKGAVSQDSVESTKETESVNNTSFSEAPVVGILSKLFGNKTNIFRNRLQTFYASERHGKISDKTQDKLIEKIPGVMEVIRAKSNSERRGNSLEISEKSRKDASTNFPQSIVREEARQFQFVFHPYLPYGKEVMPDEKISIHDVLPVKMVKFIKSMVEEAPWEAMFMKMIRMVVDQFVDKIIEKMFANKEGEEEDKWRSADGPLIPTSSILPLKTSVERLRRSAEIVLTKTKDSRRGNSVPSRNHISKENTYSKMNESDDSSWLDLFLDYVFPEDLKTDDKPGEEREFMKRMKRGIVDSDVVQNSESPKFSIAEFLNGIDSIHVSLKLQRALKDFIKYRILKRILRPFQSWRDTTDTTRVDLNAYPGYLMSSHRQDEPHKNLATFLYSQVVAKGKLLNLVRRKRSSNGNNRRDFSEIEQSWLSSKKMRSFNSKKDDDKKRLWQSDHKMKSSNFKRDDCSLRRACNAGRLLARLPSVQDITLQLRSYHHEPHWDALLWGMKKKRCSRIFCSRQRSPKGSKNSWNASDKRQSKKALSTTHRPRHYSNDVDMTTIIPI